MQTNDLGALLSEFKEESECKKYLQFVRWGEWPSCPYCSNPKVYFIIGGRYKCANPSCHKKFSITVKTLMENSKLSLLSWMNCVALYVKKRGVVFTWDIQKAIECSDKTAFYTKEKLDFAYQYVDTNGLTHRQIFDEIFKSLFTRYYHLQELRKAKYGTHFWHVSDIDNIADPKQYNRLCSYAKMRMFTCRWIYISFASPQDVMAETFLYMQDNNIKEYDATSMVRLINSIIQKMWKVWIAAHPNIDARYRAKYKEYKRDWRLNIKDGYVVDMMKKSKEFRSFTTSEIWDKKDEVRKYKERIKQMRMRLKRLYDFESHFS
jgi:hypothetical protein